MSRPHPSDANARFGLKLFLVYTVFYAGFVLVSAFAAQWSEWELWGGLNLAVLWGFALIGMAFVLALIYGLGCQAELSDQPADGDSRVSATEVDGAEETDEVQA